MFDELIMNGWEVCQQKVFSLYGKKDNAIYLTLVKEKATRQVKDWLSSMQNLQNQAMVIKDEWDNVSSAYEQMRRLVSDPKSLEVMPLLLMMFASACYRQD